jgi:methyl-accepting chemotaxis protein
VRDVVQTKGAVNEVRNLDQRSAAAAREIKALVDGAGQNTGIEQVSGAITQMDQATSQIAGPCRGSSGRHGRLGKGLMQG